MTLINKFVLAAALMASATAFAKNGTEAVTLAGLATSTFDRWVSLDDVTNPTHNPNGAILISATGASFSALSYKLFDGATVVASGTGLLSNGAYKTSFVDTTLPFNMQSGQLYKLSVTATTTAASGGNVSVLWTKPVTVTPVPEPESYAMLLAGLGIMGGIARRRIQK